MARNISVYRRSGCGSVAAPTCPSPFPSSRAVCIDGRICAFARAGRSRLGDCIWATAVCGTAPHRVGREGTSGPYQSLSFCKTTCFGIPVLAIGPHRDLRSPETRAPQSVVACIICWACECGPGGVGAQWTKSQSPRNR